MSLRYQLIGYQHHINEVDSLVPHWLGKEFPLRTSCLDANPGEEPKDSLVWLLNQTLSSFAV